MEEKEHPKPRWGCGHPAALGPCSAPTRSQENLGTDNCLAEVVKGGQELGDLHTELRDNEKAQLKKINQLPHGLVMRPGRIWGLGCPLQQEVALQ